MDPSRESSDADVNATDAARRAGAASPVDTASALLRTLTPGERVGVWSAPGRVNLIGEHTDYHDGFVFPFATPHRTAAAVAVRDDDVLRVASTFTAEPVEVRLEDLDAAIAAGGLGWAAYPLGVAWALRRAAADPAFTPSGLDIAIASDVPIGAGLSSSAAIESAVAGALNDLWGAGLDPAALARVGRTAENEAVGAPTGIMDQLASMLGRPDAALFIDCRTHEATPIDLGFAAAGLTVLVIDTRTTHAHATGGYGERRASCEAGAAALGVPTLRDLSPADLDRARAVLDETTFRRVRHVVTENQRVLDTVRTLRENGPAAIGPLLTASHASMRDDFEISTPELDLAVETALTHGALGARMTGGGFGGAAVALIPVDRAPEAAAAVRAAFAPSGFETPDTFTVRPSAGAHRDT